MRSAVFMFRHRRRNRATLFFALDRAGRIHHSRASPAGTRWLPHLSIPSSAIRTAARMAGSSAPTATIPSAWRITRRGSAMRGWSRSSSRTHGFTLLKHAADVDFANPADVQQRWYPEACRLVQELTGATRSVRLHGHPAGRRGKPGEAARRSAPMWISTSPPCAAGCSAWRRSGRRSWRASGWSTSTCGAACARCAAARSAVCDARSVEKGGLAMLVRFGDAPPPPGPVPGGFNRGLQPEAPLVLLPGHGAGRGHRLPAVRHRQSGLAHDRRTPRSSIPPRRRMRPSA